MTTPKEIAKFICKFHNDDYNNQDYLDKVGTLTTAYRTIMICEKLFDIQSKLKDKTCFLQKIQQAIMNMREEERNFYKLFEQVEEPAEREEITYTDDQKLEMLYEQEQQERDSYAELCRLLE